MAWKRPLVSNIECNRIQLNVLRKHKFIRQPQITIGRYHMEIRGIVEPGMNFTLEVNRITGEGRDSPSITPCDPAQVPEKLVPDYTTYGRGTYTTVRRNT